MDRKRAKRIIKAMAKREGKDENLIRDEMTKAIIMGYMDTEKQKNWTELFGEGSIPGFEEFIIQISSQVKRNTIQG